MFMLCFYVGKRRYAIDNQHILRVVPQVRLSKNDAMPFYLAGLLRLEGQDLPVVDFCQLIEERNSASLLHSRIILLEDSSMPSPQVMGLLAEKVTDTIQFDAVQKSSPVANFPYLKKAVIDPGDELFILDVASLFRFLFKHESNEAIERPPT